MVRCRDREGPSGGPPRNEVPAEDGAGAGEAPRGAAGGRAGAARAGAHGARGRGGLPSTGKKTLFDTTHSVYDTFGH